MTAQKERIEVITRGERRRNWTAEQKREIALESLAPGRAVAEVARQHELSTGLLYTWRKQLRSGELCGTPQARPRFLPVDVPARAQWQPSSEPASRAVANGPAAPLSALPDEFRLQGMIEVVLTSGVRVRIGAGADATALRQVLAMLAGR